MAKVDDLLERRAKQVVLAIVARLAHRSPRQRISPSKESRTAQIGNPKSQETPHAHPAFLQNRLLAQVKSSRSINRFRILHGRPISLLIFGRKEAQHRANLHMGPLATARGANIALIELRGNGVVACNARPLDLLNDRQHIGRKLPRIRPYSSYAAVRGPCSFRICSPTS